MTGYNKNILFNIWWWNNDENTAIGYWIKTSAVVYWDSSIRLNWHFPPKINDAADLI